ncbi:MAG: phasin family protein [Pseudomonas sp.]
MAETKVASIFDSGVSLATDVADSVKSQTRQVWLATLGAYAKAGKDGMAYFKELVAEGAELEEKGKDLFSEQLDNANSKLAEYKELFSKATGGRLEKVASSIEEGRSEVLGRFGIPSSSELEKLSAKLDEVTATLKKAS